MATEFGTVAAVRALVTDPVFKRAQETSDSGKLSAVVFEEGESLLKGRAECIGSSPSDVYSLSVSIDVKGPAAVGECSCPAGKSAKAGLCKHAVALLLRRIQEVQRRSQPNGIFDSSKGVSGKEDEEEELVVPIASQQVGSDIRRQGSSQHGTKNFGYTTGGPQPTSTSVASSSKRALPAWMLGVTASTPMEPPPNPPKSRKRAATTAAGAPPSGPAGNRPPRPLPPLARRARRGSGRQLRISSEGGGEEEKEEEDPGEVDDAGPMEVEESNGSRSRSRTGDVVLSEEEVPDPVVEPSGAGPAAKVLSEGAAARERRRVKALKKEELAAAAAAQAAQTAGDDEEDLKGSQGRRRRGSARSSASRAGRGGDPQAQTQAEDQDHERPGRAGKRRRLVKKRIVNDDIDLSETEVAPLDVDDNDYDDDDRDEFRLTEDDLRLLAQENLQRESTAHSPAKDLRAEAEAGPGRLLEKVEEQAVPNKSRQGTRSLSSMSKWRELTSSDAGGGGTSCYRASSLKADDLDLETLKSVSQGTSSQALGLLDGVSSLDASGADTSRSNVPTSAPATGMKDISAAPMADAFDDSDTVAASMLSIWFGPDIGGQTADKHVPVVQGNVDVTTAPASSTAVYSIPEKRLDMGAKTGFDDVAIAVQPQSKKASLKDKLKRFTDE